MRIVLLALAFVLCAPGSADRASAATVSEPCPVTIPTRTVPQDGGFTAASFNYGGRYLRAYLGWPRGVLRAGTLPGGGSFATIEPDGSIYTKIGWWRGRPGKLVITGRRLDAPAPPLRASTSATGYGNIGFQPSGLVFPTVGCWRVVGRVATTRLVFVVKVTKI